MNPEGMTLRDWFAAHALPGLLGNSKYGPSAVESAYSVADSMLKVRQEQSQVNGAKVISLIRALGREASFSGPLMVDKVVNKYLAAAKVLFNEAVVRWPTDEEIKEMSL